MFISIVVVNFCSVSLACLVVNALSLVLCIVNVVVAATAAAADDATATTAVQPLQPSPLLLSIAFVIVIVAVNLTVDDVGFHCCAC